MDSVKLTSIANSTAGRYGLTLEPSAMTFLSTKLSQINSPPQYPDASVKQDAVEAALRVVFIEATRLGTAQLDDAQFANILRRLCPLPPIC